jgi:hypothetical protein
MLKSTGGAPTFEKFRKQPRRKSQLQVRELKMLKIREI